MSKNTGYILLSVIFAIAVVIALSSAGKKAAILNDETAVGAYSQMPQKEEHAQKDENVCAVSVEIAEYCQHPDYPTGCESAALYILLNYYGTDATMEDIVEALPKGPTPYIGESGAVYGADPDAEFVGDPASEDSYGVFEGPIAKTANKFREGAVGESGLGIEDVEKILRGGVPLIAWISLDPEGEKKESYWYHPVTGKRITWIKGEHAVTVYGFTDSGFLVSDPKDGKKKTLPREDFQAGFLRHGGRVVYYPEGE